MEKPELNSMLEISHISRSKIPLKLNPNFDSHKTITITKNEGMGRVGRFERPFDRM